MEKQKKVRLADPAQKQLQWVTFDNIYGIFRIHAVKDDKHDSVKAINEFKN